MKGFLIILVSLFMAIVTFILFGSFGQMIYIGAQYLDIVDPLGNASSLRILATVATLTVGLCVVFGFIFIMFAVVEFYENITKNL